MQGYEIESVSVDRDRRLAEALNYGASCGAHPAHGCCIINAVNTIFCSINRITINESILKTYLAFIQTENSTKFNCAEIVAFILSYQ